MISKITRFIKTDLWRIRLTTISPVQSFFIRLLRTIVLALRGFDEDKCNLKASALTYYTLLSIVPLVAMAFGIAKGFGLEALLEKQLLEKMAGQEKAFTMIIDFSRTMLDNTKGGLIAGIGVAFLFWTVIKLLTNIEKSFNDIWGIVKPRNLKQKFSSYLSAMLLCPLLFIMASSLTVAVSGQITTIINRFDILQAIGPVIFALLKLLPYCVIWLLFTFLYVFMPNTQVKIRAALSAGIVAGTMYQIVQWGYISFQIGAGQYNAIYGSFAALPLFLIWLQLSWLIVLFGAEISFALQNVSTYEFEPDCKKISPALKRLLSLSIVHLIVKRFELGKPPASHESISNELDLPIRLVNQILFELTSCGLISETISSGEDDTCFQPALNTDLLTVQHVIFRLEKDGGNNIPVIESAEIEKIKECLNSFSLLTEKSSENKKLKDL